MEDTFRELLLGCGRARDKRILTPANPTRDWRGLHTCDMLDTVGADVVWDLESPARFPWPHNYFDEVHAYEVLEHLGQQGDWRSFFTCFERLWQIMKPGAYLAGTCPSRYSSWLWGDPGHTRAILPETLGFLSQLFYTQCDGDPPKTMASDYRAFYRADFEIKRSEDDRQFHRFVLQAVKPARGVIVSVPARIGVDDDKRNYTDSL